jgi:hypothetical protein
MLEDLHPCQVSALLSIAQKTSRPIGELAVEAMRFYLASMDTQERAEAIEILAEGGIDWAKIE